MRVGYVRLIKHYVVDIVMILQQYDWVFHRGRLAALGHWAVSLAREWASLVAPGSHVMALLLRHPPREAAAMSAGCGSLSETPFLAPCAW